MNWKRRYRKLKNPLSKLGITLCSQVAILSLTQSLEHPHSLFISKKCFRLQVLISKETLFKPEGHLLFSKNDVGRAGNYSLGSVKVTAFFPFWITHRYGVCLPHACCPLPFPCKMAVWAPDIITYNNKAWKRSTGWGKKTHSRIPAKLN